MKVEPVTKEEATVAIINSISDVYPDLRQDGKNISFALQYGCTKEGLMKNFGLSVTDAERIYERYHSLYKQSLQWKESKIKEAYEKGYVEVAFGLRVRTPALKGKKYTLNRKGYEGIEARTAGNALGQGWGVLNDRTMNEVLKAIDELGLTEKILPIGKIHDSTYYLVSNEEDVLLKLNELIVKETNWNDHPDIYHPKVGLGGKLQVFKPNWANPITLPENCSKEDLRALMKETLNNE